MISYKEFCEATSDKKLEEDGEAVATNNVSSGSIATYDKPIGDVQKRKALTTEEDNHGPEDGEDPDGKVQAGGL